MPQIAIGTRTNVHISRPLDSPLRSHLHYVLRFVKTIRSLAARSRDSRAWCLAMCSVFNSAFPFLAPFPAVAGVLRKINSSLHFLALVNSSSIKIMASSVRNE